MAWEKRMEADGAERSLDHLAADGLENLLIVHAGHQIALRATWLTAGRLRRLGMPTAARP